MTATLVKSIDGRCAYVPTGRGQCKRGGNTTVPGVEQLLCRQHARIVATEPGAAGVVRAAPADYQAILAELRGATTQADVARCRAAITTHIGECADQMSGLKPELSAALVQAKARVNGARR